MSIRGRGAETKLLEDIEQIGLVNRLGQTSSEEITCNCAILAYICADCDDRRTPVQVIGTLDVSSGRLSVYDWHVVVHQYAIKF